MPKQDTQLTTPESFNPSSIIFEACTKRSIPDNPDMSYHQTNLKMKYPNGAEGPIIFELPRCPTFGISNKFGSTPDKLSLSIILGEKDNFSEEHKSCINVINELVKVCKEYILTDEIKSTIGMFDLEDRDLKEFSPLKYQRDKDKNSKTFGKLLTDKPPIFNAKMMVQKNKETKAKEITSRFYAEDEVDENGNPLVVDPHEYISKVGYCTTYVKIESIYFGAKIKLQCKIYECIIKSNDTGFKSLINRNKTVIRTNNSSSAPDLEDYNEDSQEEVQEEEKEPLKAESEAEEEPEPVVEEQPKKTVGRRGTSKK